MKTAHKFAAVSAVVFSAFAFAALAGSAAQAAPITPPGSHCVLYTLDDTDCSLTSDAPCAATVLGEAADCYRNTIRDDRLPVHVSGGTIY